MQTENYNLRNELRRLASEVNSLKSFIRPVNGKNNKYENGSDENMLSEASDA